MTDGFRGVPRGSAIKYADRLGDSLFSKVELSFLFYLDDSQFIFLEVAYGTQ